MKFSKEFLKRYYFQQVVSYLVVCCLFVVCHLFYSMSPSATLARPNGKSFWYGKFHRNPHSNLPTKVKPAGIKAYGTVPNIPNTHTVGHGTGGNIVPTKGNYGNIFKPQGKTPCATAPKHTVGAKNNQIGSNGFPTKGPGKKVLFSQPGSNILVEINPFAKNKIGVKNTKNNCKSHISGFAAGDAFSKAIVDNGGWTNNGHCNYGNKGIGAGNSWKGNQRCGVALGCKPNSFKKPFCKPRKPQKPVKPKKKWYKGWFKKWCKKWCKKRCKKPCKPEPEPTPKPVLTPEPEATLAPVAPLPIYHIPKLRGCPELSLAAAAELGIPSETLQIGIGASLAHNSTIQPCQACAILVNAASILKDVDGSRIAAMLQVFDAIAPADAPFTPEMATSIVMAFEDAAEGSQYTSAMEYINAFVEYAATLDALGSPVGDSTSFVMDKYGSGLGENANMAAFVAARMEGGETF